MDDTSSTDALIHFLPSIAFIQAELEEKKRGVLVHCQAGMSTFLALRFWDTLLTILQVEALLLWQHTSCLRGTSAQTKL